MGFWLFSTKVWHTYSSKLMKLKHGKHEQQVDKDLKSNCMGTINAKNMLLGDKVLFTYIKWCQQCLGDVWHVVFMLKTSNQNRNVETVYFTAQQWKYTLAPALAGWNLQVFITTDHGADVVKATEQLGQASVIQPQAASLCQRLNEWRKKWICLSMYY